MTAGPIRTIARDGALRILSIGRRIDATSGWIRFPYYHQIEVDERPNFARHLDYLRGFGDLISLDNAAELLASGDLQNGRYFSISFDDGFKSCIANALPILAERGIPATFYVVTDMVGRALLPGDRIAEGVFGSRRAALEFMSWDDCRTLVRAGMTVGSHTRTHPRLAFLGAERVAQEMSFSRMAIERETGQPCRHFCAPYGIPGHDFDAVRDPGLARAAGYVSFATGKRGKNSREADLFALRRDHMLASWGNHQLRYFLSTY